MPWLTTIEDVSREVKGLLSWKDKLSTKEWDFKGLRIKNASPGVDPNDYATVSQIPVIEKLAEINDLNYTIVYAKDGSVSTSDVIPRFIVGKGREGIAHQLMLNAASISGTLTIVFKIKPYGLPVITLGSLSVTAADTPAYTSTFSAIQPTLGYLHLCYPEITSAGGAEGVTIQLVTRRFRSQP